MPEAPAPDLSPAMPRPALALPVEGMTCAACAGRVRRALLKVPGVTAAEVNPVTGRAAVMGQADLGTLANAVAGAGYRVPEAILDLAVGGMTCASCVARVERALARVPGVLSVQVNLATAQAHLRAVAGTTEAALGAALVAAGYRLVQADRAGGEDAAAAREARDLLAAALLSAPFLLGMAGMALGQDWMPGGWVQAGLATPVVFWLGARFWRAGFAALRAGSGNMDQLVAIGTGAAWGLSMFLLLRHGGGHAHALYFEAAAVVVFFVLLGRWLETRARRATGAAIAALLGLAPRTARRIDGGTEHEVPAAALAVHDLVVVRPGERIPADGVVREGSCGIDESALTGESRTVEKDPGAQVSTGTIVLDGRLVIEVRAIGEETMLARVAALVAAAQASRAPVQKLVDRVSAVFVPVVMGIAALTLAGWLAAGAGLEQAVITAVSVLVIACPCALGLATPAAIMAGTGAAARAGILVRDMEAIERAQAITLVAFDKTGTLTEGRPRLVALHPAAGVAPAQALRLAAALQAGSEHPLARAVAAAAAEAAAPPPVEDFRALPGRGVEGVVEGRRLALGSPRLLAERGAVAAGLGAPAAAEAAAGRSLAWLIEGDAALALLAFEDAPKPGAAGAIAALHAAGLRTAMLSGDLRAAAQGVATRLGIDDLAAEVLPADKAARIAAWQAQGQRVAMVGDGVNDAPALAQADLGIAMGTGTDVAIAAAGITLLRGDPALVPAAIEVARRTQGKIRQNLAWAFGYNIIGLPLAAAGLLSPVVAGAAMALSSVSVMASALWLARWRPREDAR
ncbi:heavy metal translocating P-type ATPase [Roseomonas fluvialis]|nr:heavy metal translocating P-type ATPase [Roseomonas fluvialis]